MSIYRASADSLRTGYGYTASFEVPISSLKDEDDILSEEDRMQLENSLRIHKELYLRLGQ